MAYATACPLARLLCNFESDRALEMYAGVKSKEQNNTIIYISERVDTKSLFCNERQRRKDDYVYSATSSAKFSLIAYIVHTMLQCYHSLHYWMSLPLLLIYY